MILLDQKIDIFKLIATIDKIIIILRLNFSYKLIDLKLYLKMIN